MKSRWREPYTSASLMGSHPGVRELSGTVAILHFAYYDLLQGSSPFAETSHSLQGRGIVLLEYTVEITVAKTRTTWSVRNQPLTVEHSSHFVSKDLLPIFSLRFTRYIRQTRNITLLGGDISQKKQLALSNQPGATGEQSSLQAMEKAAMQMPGHKSFDVGRKAA